MGKLQDKYRSFRPARKSQRVLGPIADAGQGGRRHEAPLRTDPFSGVFRKTAKKTSVILTNQRKHPLALLNNRLAKPPQVQLKLKLSSNHDVGGGAAEKSVGVSGGNCKTCRGIGGFIETALPVSRK